MEVGGRSGTSPQFHTALTLIASFGTGAYELHSFEIYWVLDRLVSEEAILICIKAESCDTISILILTAENLWRRERALVL
jgi:hypothetical protein